LAIDLAGKVKITKVNTEDPANQDLVAEYQIQNLPNLKLFKDGKIIGSFTGLLNKETLKGDIFALLNN
ncbi:MAG: thioredoxin domain-containing protein, partial [Patescibacteria group bacterium]